MLVKTHRNLFSSSHRHLKFRCHAFIVSQSQGIRHPLYV